MFLVLAKSIHIQIDSCNIYFSPYFFEGLNSNILNNLGTTSNICINFLGTKTKHKDQKQKVIYL
jgi:hypothetical protein